MDAVVDLEAVLDMCREAKLPKPYWVRWAVECAERVISIWVAEYPNDLRPVQAIEAAKSWISTPTPAAADAARAAARDARDAADSAHAAANAAYSAAYVNSAAASAASAAYYAAYSTAYAAATYSTDAANAAETLWQVSRLLEIYHEANSVSPEGE